MDLLRFRDCLLITLSIITIFNVHLDSAIAADKLPQGMLYESNDKSGKSINYFDSSEDFSDVQDLIDNEGLAKAALLCARGVFILYNDEYYESDSEDDVAILAGTDTCVPPGSMKSLLFAQGYIDTSSDTLTVFGGERFVTPMYFINRQKEDFPRPLQQFGQIQAFILMGSKEWVITTKKGTTYCLKAGSSSDFPVCPVSNAAKYFSKEEQFWIQAKRGCPSSYTSLIKLDYCFNRGSGKLEEIVGSGGGGSTPTTEATVAPAPEDVGGLFDGCFNNDDDEFAELLKLRMTHDFQDVYQPQFPFNKAHAWRTEILDNTIEIITASYADELIHRQVLLFARELYIYFAEKLVWSQGKGWPSNKPTQRVKLVAHEVSRCLNEMSQKGWLARSKRHSEKILKDMESGAPGFMDKQIHTFFKPVEGYDIVMEFIWLSINLVGAACHSALEFTTDFWMEYMNVAYDMYLHPMAEFWGKPGKPLLYYPILLAGYNIKRQYQGLAAAVTQVYSVAPMEKLPRPEQVKMAMTSSKG